MNLFDYINLISGYIISSLENKKDKDNSVVFSFKPIRDIYTNNLYYELEEKLNDDSQNFYLKFPCSNKEEFYGIINKFLIQYVKNSDLLIYSAINETKNVNNVFSIVTKNRASINFLIEDENDVIIFNEFKEYLNDSIMNNKNDSINCDYFEEISEKVDEVVTLRKIML